VTGLTEASDADAAEIDEPSERFVPASAVEDGPDDGAEDADELGTLRDQDEEDAAWDARELATSR
jgi:hypothetical protein